MRKYFGAAAVVVFLVALALAIWGGGRNVFESPVASIPSVLIDHDHNDTEFFVHGLNDFKYTNMTITVSNGTSNFTRFKENAYFIYHNTSMLNFTFNITVWNRDKEYNFNGSVQVHFEDEYPLVLTVWEETHAHINVHALSDSGLPWKKFMERVR